MRALLLLVLVLAGTPVEAQRAADAPPRITTTLGLRLRAGPADTARVLRSLGLGTIVSVQGTASGTWLPVVTSLGHQGWIAAEHTIPYPVGGEFSALVEIARAYLEPQSRSFEETVAAINLLEHTLRRLEDRPDVFPADAEPRVLLLRLQLLQAALDRLAGPLAPGYESDWNQQPPLREAWLLGHAEEFSYAEVQGQGLVSPSTFWALHERFRKSPLAEEIAWAAATAPLGGECEGDPVCMFAWAEPFLLYLQAHPRGAHAQAATHNLGVVLGLVIDGIEHYRSCRPYDESPVATLEQIEDVRRTLSAVDRGLRAQAEKNLERIRRLCHV